MSEDILQKGQDLLNHTPRGVDRVQDMQFTPDGKPDMGKTVTIIKWDDGYGNIIYTANPLGRSFFNPLDIKPLSDRINTQKASFRALEQQEQDRIYSEFSSPDTASSAQPYKDYLQNESLGRRFEELKTNPPRPFGNK